MDDYILQGLQNRLYEKRKSAAYEVEKLTRECFNNNDTTRIKQIIDILCQDFIYGPSRVANATFGGLIGLAAVVIAIGQDVSEYLEDIVPTVLSCFLDQEHRVRYYACESMYNIAKVAKGEILLYFNEIFDALSKLSSDTEPSVKNGAELLDRLIKDIVSEKATSYISVLRSPSPVDSPKVLSVDPSVPVIVEETKRSSVFSLEKFIPMLSERIYVINPFTRMFLVSWITVLDSVPDLELITYLPKFLDGLIKFLSDSHQDVRNATDRILTDFLSEIKRISNIRKELLLKKVKSSVFYQSSVNSDDNDGNCKYEDIQKDDLMFNEDGKWISGQDVFIHYSKIIEILLPHIKESIQLMALRWIAEFFNICPVDLLKFTPRLISLVLPALSLGGESSRQAALEINQNLCNLVSEVLETDKITSKLTQFHSSKSSSKSIDLSFQQFMKIGSQENDIFSFRDILDYSNTVNALTLQFSDEHEQTRIAALNWLIMLHNLAPQKVLTLNDGTFPALLKILSDPNDEIYRRLLETRGSLIVRQLCIYLKSEKIYCTLAKNLEKDEDLEFASIMVQNLNNNLMTSPELSGFRKRLKNLEFKDGQSLFISLYRCWCHNAVATFSLCLLAQAYEQASNLLQIFAELEMTVSMLVQIDTLVQLLESPVFTYLRLQLLEPDKYPYLYKCLYGLLMLLPQSSAFSTLNNRLNSVSSIGLFQFFSKQ
ncbi:hypothetical protein PMAC_001035 [Pneumocystis sp. 'macacae']|nr:hypothetical protein PMAC_001035 [Pneumocystis sp. 'macacae']